MCGDIRRVLLLICFSRLLGFCFSMIPAFSASPLKKQFTTPSTWVPANSSNHPENSSGAQMKANERMPETELSACRRVVCRKSFDRELKLLVESSLLRFLFAANSRCIYRPRLAVEMLCLIHFCCKLAWSMSQL